MSIQQINKSVDCIAGILHSSVTVIDVYEAVLYFACYATNSAGGFLSIDGKADYFDMVVGSYHKKRLASKGGVKISEYTIPETGGIANCGSVWLYKSPSTGWLLGLETVECPDVSFLETINLLSKGAIGFIHANERAERHGDRDPLTGLFSRGKFYRDLKHLAVTSVYKRYPLWLLFIDLNNFKAVNDTLGHKIGDRILQNQAFYIARVIADAGMAYRYGGDEFCVLLPGAKEDNVLSMARRIEISSEQAPGGITVTASVGVALYSAGENIEAFIARADTEMYTNKEIAKKKAS